MFTSDDTRLTDPSPCPVPAAPPPLPPPIVDPWLPFSRIRVRVFALWLVASLPITIGLLYVVRGPIAFTVLSVWLYTLTAAWFVWCRQRHGLRIRRMFGRVPNAAEIATAVGLGCTLVIFSMSFFMLGMGLVGMSFPAQTDRFFDGLEESPILPPQLGLEMIIQFAVIVVFAPLVEEMLFRGVILHRWGIRWGTTAAMLITAVVFGMAHMNMVGIAMVGLVAAVLYLKSQSLWLPIICHSTNNLVAVAMGLFPAGDAAGAAQTMSHGDFLALAATGAVGTVLTLPVLLLFIITQWPSRRASLPYFAMNDADVPPPIPQTLAVP